MGRLRSAGLGRAEVSEKEIKTSTAGGTENAPKREETVMVSKEQCQQVSPQLSPMTDLLGAQLKLAYGKLLTAPVPDKILDLIKKLEAEDCAVGQKDSAEVSSKEKRQ